ncbi:MAG: hypothetical protein JSV41_00545 [Gemmatimonadota bacterium]|nr:MAG: hypothetical protein JSV41_00545 [Gemmatimonadota bacterium]
MAQKSLPRIPAGVIITGLGFLVLLVYLGAATGLVRDVNKLLLILAFAIGPAAIVGVLSISERLARRVTSMRLKVGTVFLVIAFALLNLMLVVQQTIFLQFRQFRQDVADEAARESLRLVFEGVNLVQLGIDASFDIFYCVGLILFAAVMYGHRDFGKFLGVFGILAAAALLIANLAAFPYLPTESGLIDFGPVTGVWWLAVIVQIVRLNRRERSVASRV